MSFQDGKKPNFVGCAASSKVRVNLSGVHQHDRDIVLNGVHTAAFAALQALPFAFRTTGFLQTGQTSMSSRSWEIIETPL
jgi:hypothetical protein